MSNTEFQFPPMGQLLRELGIRPVKGRSQHFLRHQQTSAAIAELCELDAQTEVLEIGAGLGNLTTELARRAGRVVAVEADLTFADWHSALCGAFPNLDLRYGDFLKLPIDDLIDQDWRGPRVATGNLPYAITAPILFALIGRPELWKRIVLMVQLEVAERLVAGTATRNSGALTYKVALEYNSRIVMHIPPGEFIPPPKVQSAVVVLEPLAKPYIADAQHRIRLHRVISGVFQHRRRTLANAIALGGIGLSRERAEEALNTCGIDPKRRPETLTLDDLLSLEAAISQLAQPTVS
jgi:16S rRNA (adenine1518-N6/adenine1519-N6)-dimethyltransferase